MDELRVDDWIEMVDVNIKGVLYGIAAALPIFGAQKSGHIINMLSTAGSRSSPRWRSTPGPRMRSVRSRKHSARKPGRIYASP